MIRVIDKSVSNKLAKMSFVCSLFVVMLHVGIGPDWIGRFFPLKSVAVPMFFLIAGYLFSGRMSETGWYVRQLKSRMKSLVVPYIVWNIAYWCFIVAISFVVRCLGVKYGGLETLDGLMGAKWDVLGVLPLSFPALGLLWFVRCLVVITLISPLFMCCTLKSGWIFVLSAYLMLFVWSVHSPVLGDQGWVRTWLLRGWIRAFIFFGAGVWMRFNFTDNLRISRKIGAIMMVFGNFCLMAGSWYTAIGMPLAMVGLWCSLSDHAWPKWLTDCAFPVYILHVFLGVVVSAVFNVLKVKVWADVSAVAWFLKWSVMAGGAMLMALGLRRFFPRLSSVVFGGR